MQRTLIFSSLIGIILTFSLAACGKRGDPYRPAEIPAKSQTLTFAS